jgi:hypothetical protein
VPTDRGEVVLSDFATAGMAGNPYLSWLPFEGLAPVPFARHRPLPAARL